ncbi:hypothetical protein HDV00_006910 [Rhizophlyctis rosea]|nr:hypothetical protein HDV00_006910 [Rhizophlyctis rosea]
MSQRSRQRDAEHAYPAPPSAAVSHPQDFHNPHSSEESYTFSQRDPAVARFAEFGRSKPAGEIARKADSHHASLEDHKLQSNSGFDNKDSSSKHGWPRHS